MKKYLYTVLTVLFVSTLVNAQEEGKEKKDFDKKFRFGLRVAAQPCWFTSNENNNKPYGAMFGTGFGLNMEFRFSDIVALSTGIGADFEGGKLTYRQESSDNYAVSYWMDNTKNMVAVEGKVNPQDISNTTNTRFYVKERLVKTTHITLPALLKMSTNEYSGFKYFGMFGAEIGIRIKSVADDKYTTSYTFDNLGLVTNGAAGDKNTPDSKNLNISKDASLVPMRIGFNAGMGFEYRLGGSTSFFMSVNYFRSFTNLMRSDSKFLVSDVITEPNGNQSYKMIEQNLIQNAIRINLGILF
ncbi:MAG: outer membrane beta-barrel protein [Sphingobacteriaceae bacterium]|nr:outer membrane beta-barrel protein [Sphingobacteriaceae bacterium]